MDALRLVVKFNAKGDPQSAHSLTLSFSFSSFSPAARFPLSKSWRLRHLAMTHILNDC